MRPVLPLCGAARQAQLLLLSISSVPEGRRQARRAEHGRGPAQPDAAGEEFHRTREAG